MKTKKNYYPFSGQLLSVAALLIVTLFIQEIRAQVHSSDSVALVKFYQSTNGGSWSSSANWLTGPVSTWEGITVTNNRVTEISLSFHNLSGSLPHHLALLSKLTTLNLSSNSISGNVPATLALLQRLETLDLSENQFSGSIPETLSLLTKLKSLNLARNGFTGNIPVLVGLLKRLTFLDLSANQLSSGIPNSIGKLSKLERLYLFQNQLSGSIPWAIGKLSNATEIYLYNNLLSGSLPSSMGHLDSLRFLNVSNNDLTGNVPSSVTSLPQVFLFNVAGNELSVLPDFSAMTSLSQLRVSDNRLTFEDLEPNISKLPSASFYIPQDSVGTSISVEACSGDMLRLVSDLAGGSANNRYQWRKFPNVIVSGTTASPELVIPNVQSSNSGVYFARITNSVVRGLTIIQRPITVTVNACAAVTTLSVASESANESRIRVYPNTFDTEVNVDVTSSTDESLIVVIRNAQGLVVETHKGLMTNVNLKVGSSLASGLYYLESYHGGKKEVVRIYKK